MSEPLRPQLRLHDAVATGLAAILGAGIFSIVAPAAGTAGPALLIALGIAAFVAFCNAMSSAQLARVLPRTGGTYQFGRMMLGPGWGFGAGWMFLVANTVGPGVIALAFAGYLHAAWPDLPVRLGAVSLALFVTVVNASGIRRSVAVTDILVVISVVSLLLFVILAAPAARLANLAPFAPKGALGIFRATGLMFFAYTGYSRIVTLVEEVQHPERTIPLATVLALVGAALLYLLVAGTALAVVGADGLARSSSPLRTTLLVAGIGGASAIIIPGALVTTCNEALSDVLGVSRMAFAMSREGDLHRRLAYLGAGQNPWPSVLFVGAIATIVAATAPFTAAVEISSFATLLYYAVANLSALRLRREDRSLPRWLSLAGLAGCLVLAFTLQLEQVLIGIGILLCGLLFRGIARARGRAR